MTSFSSFTVGCIAMINEDITYSPFKCPTTYTVYSKHWKPLQYIVDINSIFDTVSHFQIPTSVSITQAMYTNYVIIQHMVSCIHFIHIIHSTKRQHKQNINRIHTQREIDQIEINAKNNKNQSEITKKRDRVDFPWGSREIGEFISESQITRNTTYRTTHDHRTTTF